MNYLTGIAVIMILVIEAYNSYYQYKINKIVFDRLNNHDELFKILYGVEDSELSNRT